MTSRSRLGARALAGVACAGGLVACGNVAAGPGAAFDDCSIPIERFTDGGLERSQIPALDNPEVTRRLIAPAVGYVNRSDEIIGLMFNGQPLAIPLKLLWYHEVVNLEVPGERLTVTYSPLTGSVSVFDPEPSGVDAFRVSNYVLDNNLVMEDGVGTLYPQLSSVATCGSGDGARLTRLPYELMTYGAWLLIFQDTWIVSRRTGHDFLYTLYPYGAEYREPDNGFLLYPTRSPVDGRRQPKERVIGVPSGDGGIAFAVDDLRETAALDQAGEATQVWATGANAGGERVVAFWNSQAQSARIFKSRVGGRTLTFEVVDGQRRDAETGSVWNFSGEAVLGPLDGEQLAPHPDARHAYWFAWAAFQPDAELWTPPPPPQGSGAADLRATRALRADDLRRR